MSNIQGKWRIQKMQTWTQEFVDLAEPGYFEFYDEYMGSFLFGTIRGSLDMRVTPSDAMLAYSWAGNSGGHELSGRGVFFFSDSNTANGTLFIHKGGQSDVSIVRETEDEKPN